MGYFIRNFYANEGGSSDSIRTLECDGLNRFGSKRMDFLSDQMYLFVEFI